MITRFAPSPTGHLHIGGVRTALFNWALARRNQGKFYLRIDDTDGSRHQEDAVVKIVDGLKWLGMDYDVPDHLNQGLSGHVGPIKDYVRQALRGFTYMEYYLQLLEKGLAYKCFCNKVEIDFDNKIKGDHKYSGVCRGFTPEELSRVMMLRGEYCLRLNVGKLAKPGESIGFNDLVLGEIKTDAGEIGDPVIFRTNGMPTYNMATVIDDHEMGITHVVRGQDHVSNTSIQLLLYRAIDVKPPQFAHLPLICAPPTDKGKKRKLSKRESDLGVPTTLEEYHDLGYLPKALVNYLGHVGWSMDGETEKWSSKEFVENFSLDRVTKSAACFDPEKLEWIQGEYMKELTLLQKVSMVIERIDPKVDMRPTDRDEHLIRATEKIVMACGDRLNVISDFDHYLHFMDDRYYLGGVHNKIDLKEIQKKITPVIEYLEAVHALLTEWDDWSHKGLEGIVREYCTDAEIKFAKLIHALRVATTGSMIGFGMFEGMEILGKPRALKRIADTIAMVNPPF